MSLALPWGLLLGLPLLGAVLLAWRRRPLTLPVPDLHGLPPDRQAWWRRRLPLLLEAGGGLLLVLAACRPQWLHTAVREERQAVDVMVALDVSGSMDAVDVPAGQAPESVPSWPSRLDCARRELDRFMRARPEDRFGLVLFARRPYPACPLTFDHELLRSRLEGVGTDLLDDGTGLSAALALGLLQTRASPSPHRVLILLTDGRDNVPAERTPEETAAFAADQGTTIHVVGIGSEQALVPVKTLAGTQYRPLEPALATPDEARLKAIAAAGRGTYGRAGDAAAFAQAIDRIAATEKGRILRPARRRAVELFPGFALAGLGTLVGALVLRRSAWGVLP